MTDSLRPTADLLDEWFRGLLAADDAPSTDLALFWHEVARIEDGPAAKPITRGPTFLSYFDQHRQRSEVPGQTGLPKNRRPERMCRSILSLNAGQPESLCRITFRYQRSGGGPWSSVLSRETFSQYKATQAALAPIMDRLVSHFASIWSSEVINMGFQYGISTLHADPGPRWRTIRTGSDGSVTNQFEPSVTPEMSSIFEDMKRVQVTA